MKYCIALLLLCCCGSMYTPAQAQKNYRNKIFVLGYYSGDTLSVSNYPVEKLTHLIFSFGHLNGNRFNLNRHTDTVLVWKMMALKQRNPQLKVILSLGGWGGCKPCSEVFATDSGRVQFAQSVKEYLDFFQADGIDLDWEYPVIEGVSGHPHGPADKDNFTALVKALRSTLGKQKEISFAAGGFPSALMRSFDWANVMPYVDRVNVMSYDLAGYDRNIAHHTPLYSTPKHAASADSAVKYLVSIGVPANKIVIGAAFYARIFQMNTSDNNGLYQNGSFKAGLSYRKFDSAFWQNPEFEYHFDSVAMAPYYWNAGQKLFVTFDDSVSVRLKTEYAINKKLNGIMFWELRDDKTEKGLLDVMDDTKRQYKAKK